MGCRAITPSGYSVAQNAGAFPFRQFFPFCHYRRLCGPRIPERRDPALGLLHMMFGKQGLVG